MELGGTEKRIQALFSELSLEDRTHVPRFEQLWTLRVEKTGRAPLFREIMGAGGCHYRRGEFVGTVVQTVPNRTQYRATRDSNTRITASRVDCRTSTPAPAAQKENCPATTTRQCFQ